MTGEENRKAFQNKLINELQKFGAKKKDWT